jgi:hypothetical protein
MSTMKISELIRQLTAYEEEFGEAQVVTLSLDDSLPRSIESLEHDQHDDGSTTVWLRVEEV